MKDTKTRLTAATIATLFACAACAAEYTLTGTRFLRKYTAPQKSQVYMAEADAQRVANRMCDVAWVETSVAAATAATHVSTNLDWNVTNREHLDAALFCADHSGDEHTAYANAACYRFDFPDGSLPTLTNLEMTVWSDPYNAYGARIAIVASDSAAIPTACATVRGDAAGGIKATGVAARVTRAYGSSSNWYPATSNLVFSVGGENALPAGGLQLKKYLFVFVLMENYATSRSNWLEGSSYIENGIGIKTSAAIDGWSSGCDVAEPYATTYHLKDGQAGEDADGDGLSNYAEYLIAEVFGLAELDPDEARSDGSTPDFFRKVGDLYLGEIFSGYGGGLVANPADALALRARYFGKRRVMAPVVLQAWNVARDRDMTGEPDETFASGSVVVNGGSPVVLTRQADKSMGLGTDGTFNAVAFADEDGDGAFTPGEPFAFLREISLHATDNVAELTDDSPVFARVDLLGGAYAARPGAVSVAVSNDTAGVTENARHTRIRVMRVMVNGRRMLGYDDWDHEIPVTQVVLDKYLDLGARSYLHEGDFITGSDCDADWSTLPNLLATKARVSTTAKTYQYIDVTNVTYAIAIGEGDISGASSNLVFRCVVNKTFDGNMSRTNNTSNAAVIRPVIDTTVPQNYVYGARPTFRFAMKDGYGNDYDGYTAFRIRLTSGGVTYETGLRDLPARDAEGWYEWTLDEAIGAKLPASGNYTWQVALYNAKYQGAKCQATAVTEWSEAGATRKPPSTRRSTPSATPTATPSPSRRSTACANSPSPPTTPASSPNKDTLYTP